MTSWPTLSRNDLNCSSESGGSLEEVGELLDFFEGLFVLPVRISEALVVQKVNAKSVTQNFYARTSKFKKAIR